MAQSVHYYSQLNQYSDPISLLKLIMRQYSIIQYISPTSAIRWVQKCIQYKGGSSKYQCIRSQVIATEDEKTETENRRTSDNHIPRIIFRLTLQDSIQNRTMLRILIRISAQFMDYEVDLDSTELQRREIFNYKNAKLYCRNYECP
jgi:hypothetical protein